MTYSHPTRQLIVYAGGGALNAFDLLKPLRAPSTTTDGPKPSAPKATFAIFNFKPRAASANAAPPAPAQGLEEACLEGSDLPANDAALRGRPTL